MRKLTACLITFNEEANVRACLEAVAFCDEVVVVDSHSTDATRQIAAELGARVIERDWPGHIEQKNFAVDQASHDWVLCVDADERVTPALRERIQEVLGSEGGPDGYTVNRLNHYLGAPIRGCGWYPDAKLRLFDRRRGRWRGVNPHDHVRLEAGAPVGRLSADLEHYTYADLSDHLKTIDYFTTIAAREKLARGQRWVTLNLVLNPPWVFFKKLVLQRGLLDGWRGFLVCALAAFYVLLRYAKLWELIHVQGLAPGGGAPVRYGRRGEDAPPGPEGAVAPLPDGVPAGSVEAEAGPPAPP